MSKTTFYGFPGPKSVFEQKIFFRPNFFFWDLAIFGPVAPGKPPCRAAGVAKRYFGRLHTGIFFAFENFFRGFAGCPSGWEVPESVAHQFFVIMILFFVLLTVVFGPIENLVVCATAGVRNNHSCSRIGNRPAGVGHRGLPATCRDLHLLVSRSGECESGMISCSPLLL